jgi:hypothetical protein
MEAAPPGHFSPLAGDLAIRARILEIRQKRLIERQLEFAAYCRAQAAAVRQDGAKSRFPELRAAMLHVVQSYERMAARSEELVCRFGLPSGVPDPRPPEPDAAEAA